MAWALGANCWRGRSPTLTPARQKGGGADRQRASCRV